MLAAIKKQSLQVIVLGIINVLHIKAFVNNVNKISNAADLFLIIINCSQFTLHLACCMQPFKCLYGTYRLSTDPNGTNLSGDFWAFI